MSGGTGLAGLAVTALVAAVVAVAAAMLVPPASAPPPEDRAAPPVSGEDLRSEVARLRGEVAELRRARTSAPASPAAGAPGGDRTPSAGSAGTEGSASPVAAAPLPATREELTALIDARIAERGGAAGPGGAPAEPEKKSVSIDEAGAAIGLSAFEIDAVRRVYRDAENEMLAAVMGTTDMDVIRQEVAAAKDDPDKKAALVNKAVGNVFRNLGHVMTIEDRRDRELKKVLPEEKVKQLKGYELKPTFEDAELEGLMKDVFEN